MHICWYVLNWLAKQRLSNGCQNRRLWWISFWLCISAALVMLFKLDRAFLIEWNRGGWKDCNVSSSFLSFAQKSHKTTNWLGGRWIVASYWRICWEAKEYVYRTVGCEREVDWTWRSPSKGHFGSIQTPFSEWNRSDWMVFKEGSMHSGGSFLFYYYLWAPPLVIALWKWCNALEQMEINAERYVLESWKKILICWREEKS